MQEKIDWKIRRKMKSAVIMAMCMIMVLTTMGCNKENDNKVQMTNVVDGNRFGLPDTVKKGVILHAFSWSFETIRESMADIAAAGYSAVQTSPINECYDGDNGMQLYGDGKWYYHYQPTDYKIGNYQLGTRDEFIEMCKEAHKYGIKVIVDVAANHTTTHTEKVAQSLLDAVGGADKLYHKNGMTDIADYSDRLSSTAYSMGGLPDIDTENPDYQKYMTDYLNACIDCGADGFRFDAARHIGLIDDPSEDEQKCDFWDNVLGNLKNKENLFVYGEVLQGNNDRIQDYIQTMGAATASAYGQTLRNCFVKKTLGTYDLEKYKCGDLTDVVLWAESHDNYINDNTSQALDDEDIKFVWAIIASREKGTPLFFDRPYGATKDNVWGELNEIGVAGNTFYKSHEIVEINHFRNNMLGEPDSIKNPEDNTSVVFIERGDKGLVIANIDDEYSFSEKVALKDGTYVDRIDGKTEYTVKNGVISGTIAEKQFIVLYNEGYKPAIDMPEVSAVASEYYGMTADEVEVTLHVSGADEGVYILGDGKETAFKDGDSITVGADLKEGDKIKLTVKAKNKDGLTSAMSYWFTKTVPVEEETFTDGMTVKFKKPADWGDKLFAYIYDDSDGGLKVLKDWPGNEMKSEGDGVYSYTFSSEWKNGLIMFSDGKNQYPGQNESGLPIEKDKEYTP